MPRIMEDNIQLKGIDELSSEDKAFVDKIVPEYYDRLKTYLQDIAQLELHFKTINTDGNRKQYIIKAKAISPTAKTFSSSNDNSENRQGWQFSKSLHESLKALENQIKKELKIDQSKIRPTSKEPRII